MTISESVWDYPRPPAVARTPQRIRVVFGGEVIADSEAVLRVLETSHPPSFYIPLRDLNQEALVPSPRHTFCEFKGRASYFDVVVGDRTAAAAAWTYLSPAVGYDEISGHVAFYPARVDECWVDDERVTPQAGSFYGGWITKAITGPFKS